MGYAKLDNMLTKLETRDPAIRGIASDVRGVAYAVRDGEANIAIVTPDGFIELTRRQVRVLAEELPEVLKT